MDENQLVTAKSASEKIGVSISIPDNKLITYGDLTDILSKANKKFDTPWDCILAYQSEMFVVNDFGEPDDPGWWSLSTYGSRKIINLTPWYIDFYFCHPNGNEDATYLAPYSGEKVNVSYFDETSNNYGMYIDPHDENWEEYPNNIKMLAIISDGGADFNRGEVTYDFFNQKIYSGSMRINNIQLKSDVASIYRGTSMLIVIIGK